VKVRHDVGKTSELASLGKILRLFWLVCLLTSVLSVVTIIIVIARLVVVPLPLVVVVLPVIRPVLIVLLLWLLLGRSL